jgi:hypothetical protein
MFRIAYLKQWIEKITTIYNHLRYVSVECYEEWSVIFLMHIMLASIEQRARIVGASANPSGRMVLFDNVTSALVMLGSDQIRSICGLRS